MSISYHVGIDMGGSGGKMGIAEFDEKNYKNIEQIHIPNKPIEILDSLYWDVFGIYRSILDNLLYFGEKYGEIETIGIDTWGASYVYLDKFGRIAEPAYHYRDLRTSRVMTELDEKITLVEVFRLTGCQPNRTYTLPQLYATVNRNEEIIDFAKQLLFLPDMFAYFLTGVATVERTIAGTSSLLTPDQQDWSYRLLEKCNIPTAMLGEIVNSGTIKGELLKPLAQTLKIGRSKIISVPGHDTACAIGAIPNFKSNQLYLSVGTNINMGIETDTPVLTKAAYRGGFKNTGGLNNKIIVYRDFPGFWIISLLMNDFQQRGVDCSFNDIEEMAKESDSIDSYVDLENPILSQNNIDIKEEITRLLLETGQNPPKSDGELVRCIFESMALKAKSYADYLENKMNIPLERVVAVNGGVRNSFLMQLICDAIGIELESGMPFATLDGNMLSQLYAVGKIKSVEEMRQISNNTFEMKKFTPSNQKNWNEVLQKAVKMGICVG